MALLKILILLALTPVAHSETSSRYRFIPPDIQHLDAVAERFDISHRFHEAFDVYVPQNRVSEFLSLIPNATLMEPDVGLSVASKDGDRHSWLQGYRTFDEVVDYLQQKQSEFPSLVSLEDYGKSREGRPLRALRIEGRSTLMAPGPMPALLLTAATHGNEIITTEVLLSLIDKLLSGYGTEPRITKLIDGKSLYFIPVVNPDGFVRRDRYSNSVDPNREYPFPENPSRRPNECISNLMKYYESKAFTGSIDFHAFGRYIMYPWGYTRTVLESKKQATFANLAREMAAANGYRTGQISHVLYISKGSSGDYYFWKTGALAMAVEMGTGFAPPPSEIGQVTQENTESTWKFIEHFNAIPEP